MSTKVVIGIIGAMGSGKSTVAEYFVNHYHASRYRFSDFLKEILDKLCIEASRTNLIDLFLVLAKRFGEDVLARPMRKLVDADSHELIIVEGIRRPADISLLRELPHFYLLGIVSDETKRYERITKRREKTDDSTKTIEQFKADEERPTETLIAQMIEQADFQINNDKDLINLQFEIDTLMEKLKNK